MKLKTRFDRLVWGILLGLALLLAGIVIAGDLRGLSAPQPYPAQAVVGVYGPVGFRFAQPMQVEDVESYLRFSPEVKGRLTWEDDRSTFWFWPSQPLDARQGYTLELLAGVSAEDGRTLRQPARWQVGVRQPRIAYLGNISSAPEVWSAAADGSQAQALTQTAGRVFDFCVAPDGEWLAYSVLNDQKGFDLWRVDREGKAAQPLLLCAADQCQSPAISPDGKWLAYVRRAAPLQTGASAGLPRIWTLELASGQTAALYTDVQITGYDPSWSPDGTRLASYDGLRGGIRILNLTNGQLDVLETKLGENGSWVAGGRQMVFNTIEVGETQAIVRIYLANLENRKVEPLFKEDLLSSEYSVPQVSPSGEWMAVGVRLVGGSPAKQLWLMRPDGSAQQAITADQTYMHGRYLWDPLGEALVIQRFKLGSSDSQPELVVWRLADHSATLVARDATLPAWLP